MKIKKTFKADIFLGLREGYSQNTHSIEEVYQLCKDYCDKVGLCVTITPTRFIYSKGAGISDGWEDGSIVGLIAYPRFPQSKYDIVGTAIELAKLFLVQFKQNRISVVTTDQTILVEKEDVL